MYFEKKINKIYTLNKVGLHVTECWGEWAGPYACKPRSVLRFGRFRVWLWIITSPLIYLKLKDNLTDSTLLNTGKAGDIIIIFQSGLLFQ